MKIKADKIDTSSQHSLAVGLNAHISKPVEMTVLEKTIRNIKSGGGALKRLSLNHNKWQEIRYEKIEKDS